MNWPIGFRDSVLRDWGEEKVAQLEGAMKLPSITSIRIHPVKGANLTIIGEPIPWSQGGYALEKRPSFISDPLWHAGGYYVQEASSMVIGSLVKQLKKLFFNDQTFRVLDLCAAPGGKSTDIISIVSDHDILVSNEVIRSRASILTENVARWGYPNHIVTSNDPQDFGRLSSFFDLVVVDAPCSGEGLFRKDAQAHEEWSETHITHCQARQKRILDDIWQAVAPEGFLVYSTCTFNKKENEEVLNWLSKTKNLERIRMDDPLEINKPIHVEENEGIYRFWPGDYPGEGFSFFVVRKKEGEERTEMRQQKKYQKVSAPENIQLADTHVISHDRNNLSIESYTPEVKYLKDKLHVIRSGLALGEWKGQLFIPNPEVAVAKSSTLIYETVELDYESALQYLRGEMLPNAEGIKGYVFFSFLGKTLGLGKGVDRRINNLYPTHWRIKKQVGFDYQPFYTLSV